MEDTIFAKIIRRELPATIVYEDEDTMAFLDIAPVRPGHTLVVSKKPFVNIFDVDQETLNAIMLTIRKVAPAILDAVGAKGVNIISNNGEAAEQVVNHIHFHLIPRYDKTEFASWPGKDYAPGEEQEVGTAIRKALSV